MEDINDYMRRHGYDKAIIDGNLYDLTFAVSGIDESDIARADCANVIVNNSDNNSVYEHMTWNDLRAEAKRQGIKSKSREGILLALHAKAEADLQEEAFANNKGDKYNGK